MRSVTMRHCIIIITVICSKEICCRNEVFDMLLQDPRDTNNRSHLYYDDSSESIEGDTYEIVSKEEDTGRLIPMDEHYEDAMRDAFEILGEHHETLETIDRLLKNATGEDTELLQHLHKLLHSMEELINQKASVVKEKFGCELTYEDMTLPIEKSTVDKLLSSWKDVKQALGKLKSTAKMEGIEELRKWLENAERKTRNQFNVIEITMAKIEAIHQNRTMIDGFTRTTNGKKQ